MANRIDELNTSYLIPGTESGPARVDDVSEMEGIEDDLVPSPYNGLLMQSLENSFSGNWQDLFGMGRVIQEPSHMDPPLKPMFLDDGVATGRETFFGSPKMNGSSVSTGNASEAKVQHMLELMSDSTRTVRGFRARGTGGGQ